MTSPQSTPSLSHSVTEFLSLSLSLSVSLTHPDTRAPSPMTIVRLHDVTPLATGHVRRTLMITYIHASQLLIFLLHAKWTELTIIHNPRLYSPSLPTFFLTNPVTCVYVHMYIMYHTFPLRQFRKTN